MEGEVHRKEPSGEIIVKPENWDDMVKKYTEREAEDKQKVLERYKTSKDEELLEAASKAIRARANRASENKHFKDHAIKYDPENPAILGLKKELQEEIVQISKRTFQTPSESLEHADLKGRVSTQKPNVPSA